MRPDAEIKLGAAVLGRRVGHQQDRVRAGQHGHRGGALHRTKAADARRVYQLKAVGEDVPGNPGLRILQARGLPGFPASETWLASCSIGT